MVTLATGDICLAFNFSFLDTPPSRAQVRRYASDGTLIDTIYDEDAASVATFLVDMVAQPSAPILWVLDAYQPSLIKIATDGTVTRIGMEWWWDEVTSGESMNTLAMTADGRIFIAGDGMGSSPDDDGGNNHFAEVSPTDGSQIALWSLAGAKFWRNMPQPVPVGTGLIYKDGLIYFHVGTGGVLQWLDLDDTTYHDFAMIQTFDPVAPTTDEFGPSIFTEAVFPNRAAFHASGDLIVATQADVATGDLTTNKVYRVAPDGSLVDTFVETLGGDGSNFCSDVVIDPTNPDLVWLGYGDAYNNFRVGRVVTLDLGTGVFTELFALDPQQYKALAVLQALTEPPAAIAPVVLRLDRTTQAEVFRAVVGSL